MWIFLVKPSENQNFFNTAKKPNHNLAVPIKNLISTAHPYDYFHGLCKVSVLLYLKYLTEGLFKYDLKFWEREEFTRVRL